MLFWFVSSHGAQDGFGPHFYDSLSKPVYLYRDLVAEFYVEQCPAMRGKAAFYLPAFCQTFTGKKGVKYGGGCDNMVTVTKEHSEFYVLRPTKNQIYQLLI